MNTEINKKNKTELVPLEIEHLGMIFNGRATPVNSSCAERDCFEFDVNLNGINMGTIYRGSNMKWIMRELTDQMLVDKIGNEIALWYN